MDSSARIANAAVTPSRKKVSKVGGKSSAHQEWTKPDLRSTAKPVGGGSASKMSKKQLVRALRPH